MKFLQKISLIFAILTLLAIIGVGFSSSFYVRGLLEQNIGKEQDLVAAQTLDGIDRFLYRRTLEIQLLAGSKLLLELMLEDDIPSEEIVKRVGEFEQFTGPWEVLNWVDLEGKTVYSTYGEEIGEEVEQDPENYKAYQAAVGGNVYVSDVVMSEETGEPVVLFSAPIRNTGVIGEPVIGVCTGHLVWSAVLKNLEIYRTENVYLYKKNGEYVGGNKIEDRKFIFDSKYAIKESLLEKTEATVMPGLETGIDSLISHIHESGYLDYPGKGWILVVETPASVAFKGVVLSACIISGTASLIILLASFLVFYILRFIVIKPIINLSEVTKKVTSGDLNERVKIFSRDELGELGISFNKMIDSLLEAQKGLEKKVIQRTKELDKKVAELEDSQRAVVNILEDVQRERDNVSKERDKIDTILKSIGDGVFVVDTNLNIVLANNVTAKLSGYSIEEMIGRPYQKILRFIHEGSVKNEINDKFVKDAITTGKVQEMANHAVLIHKDGARIPVADSAAPLKDESGKSVGCVVVFRDVTKERAIDKAKTEFVSLASHQLRTPLSAINWYSEMLLDGDAGKLSVEQARYMQEIARGNKRMIDLVSALLNVSRLELGTFSIEPGSVKIVEVADNELKALEQKIKEKNLKVSKKYAENVPKKYPADAKLLAIIIGNILSNAVKYTPERGKVDLSVSKEKSNILIIVKDTGYGIPKAQQKRIFEKLFRADNIRAMDTDGTGLGLYIVKMILDQVGGKIWFESVEGKGTKFYVEMPEKGWQKKEGTKKLE